MVDPPTYRAEPDPEFADRLERVLLQRLTAPAGSRPRSGAGATDNQGRTDTDAGDQGEGLFNLETDVGPTGHEPVTSRRRTPPRWLLVAAAAAVIAVAGTLLVTAGGDDDDDGLDTVTSIPPTGPVMNGWVALAGDGDIHLVRPGQDARRLDVAGSDTADDSCPSWSPDGTRLSFGRVTGSSDTASSRAELVIVPVDRDGAIDAPNVIALDGFQALPGFDLHPCATWAPDGRWVAFVGTGDVWVADTLTGAIRRLPDLRPFDLEWRPGTDELAIAGDIGPDRSAPYSSTPVTIYSVSSGELRELGSVRAARITWSPDGRTLAYQGGEDDTDELRLVDADGANDRLLTHVGTANHGVGPVWSPTGERIVYQRLLGASGERHEVVVVNVADGNETVIDPPTTDGPTTIWYPSSVTWSPDGTTLLYGAEGVLAVRADTPTNATVLHPSLAAAFVYDHQWGPVQMWGRQPA